MKPKLATGVNLQQVGDEGLLLNVDNDELHQLNATAYFIVEHCDGECTLDDIVQNVVECFEIDEETAKQDVAEIINQLGEAKLVELS